MFTGLIRELGEVRKIAHSGGKSLQLTIKCAMARTLEDGASVSINGACHTVIKKDNETFTVESTPETVFRTTIGKLRISDKVNLEPALTLNQALDGHLVQGHVDGVGKILSLRPLENSILMSVQTPAEILSYMVPKGSVAVDGVSLTIVGCYPDNFSVSLIPYSAKHTTLGSKRTGDTVNLEIDIIGKYVHKMLNPANFSL